MPIRFLSKPHLYEIKKLLGESHLSQVLLAKRLSNTIKLKQYVVLKIFKQNNHELSNLQIESFLRAQHCFHLVKILGFEHIDKQPALILEYIHGVNLKQLLETSQLSNDEKSYICHEILQGLLELKQVELAHGDLSPSNILIDYTGKVFLIDYGLANYKGSNIYGTQPFIAPEINSFQKPNLLSDLFSLGVLEKVIEGNFSESELSHMKNHHFICKNNQLLDIKPFKRKAKEFSFSFNAPYLLGQKVNKILFTQEYFCQLSIPESFSMKTQYYHFFFRPFIKKIRTWFSVIYWNPKQWIKFKRLGFLSTVFLAVLFSVNPFTSYGQYSIFKFSPPQVLIRTHKWVYIELAGHKGYSPLNITVPQVGIYEMKWKTQYKKGEKRIYLTGEHKTILKDNDFQ